MPCHILCPECAQCLGDVYEFINYARQGFYKTLVDKQKVEVAPDKIEISTKITEPIGFILDAAKLTNICCRTHILGITNFDMVYK